MSEKRKREILEEGENFRVVLLSKSYNQSNIGDQIVLFRWDFYERYVALVQRDESTPPIHLQMSCETADAFCEAWQEWKANRAERHKKHLLLQEEAKAQEKGKEG